MYNYSAEHNIMFVHIPKNAGTSIINSLGMDSKKVKHYPLSVLQAYTPEPIFDNSIKIAVLRNPWERMASYYRYRQEKKHDPTGMKFGTWLRHGGIQYNMSTYDSLPQIKWCVKQDFVDMPKSIDYIFNYEKLSEQWEEFCQIENIKAKPLPILNSTGDYNYTQYYGTLEDIVLVNNLFKSDIKLFDYDFGVPNDFPLLKGEQEIINFLNGK